MSKIVKTKEGAALSAQATLADIVEAIRAYDRRTAREEYTDTVDAWELFHDIKLSAMRVLAEFRRAKP